MAKQKRNSANWKNPKDQSFTHGPQGFQKKGTTGVRKGMR